MSSEHDADPSKPSTDGAPEAGMGDVAARNAGEGVYIRELRAGRRSQQAEAPNAGRKGLFLVLGLAMVVAGVVALVLGGMQEKGIYAKQVDTLLQERGKFQGKAVRAEGNLVHGTLIRRVSPCEYLFTIEKNGTSMPVRFADCVVPDTFRDVPGMDLAVTVEGKLLADNSFEATNVLAKCPSKYEMKQRQGQGESMPHSLSGVGPATSAPSGGRPAGQYGDDAERRSAKAAASAQPM